MKKRRELERQRQLALAELARPLGARLGVVEGEGVRPVVDFTPKPAQRPKAEVLEFRRRERE